MARFVYVVLVLALGALVSGFFVRTSSLPLLVSTGLSGLVAILILVGWSRRLREHDAFSDEKAAAEDEAAELTVVEVTTDDDTSEFRPVTDTAAVVVTRPKTKAKAKSPGAKPKAKTKAKPKAKASKPRPRASASATGAPRRVLVIPGRSRFHAPGCRFAKGDNLREVTETTARRRGYVPCGVCLPGVD